MRVELRPGCHVAYEGERFSIEALDGPVMRLRRLEGERSAVVVGVDDLAAAATFEANAPDPTDEAVPGEVGAELLPPEHRRLAEDRLGHLLEARSGYRSGSSALAQAKEPRASYDPRREPSSVRRLDAKASELGTSRRTLQRWWSGYQRHGLAGLVDDRVTAPRRVLPSVDPRVKQEALTLVENWAEKSTPTARQLGVHLKVAVEDRYGDTVPMPVGSTLGRLLREVSGPRATRSTGRRRRESANEPATPFGRVEPSRPGRVVEFDSSPVNAFAYDPHTLEYQALELSVGIDVFSSSVTAIRYTPVNAKAVDAVLLLRDTVSPKLFRPGWPDEACWRYPGIPEQVVISCLTGTRKPATDQAPLAGIPFVRAQSAVCDNGMIYASVTFREGCATLGIDLLLANPATPTDKPHVERFFETYDSTFAVNLPAAKGRDVTHRGRRPEDDAIYFVSELEELTYEWLATYYQRAPHEGNRLACDPRRPLSPNEMFDEGVARAGFVHVPPRKDIYVALLPRRARKVTQRGVKLFNMWFDAPVLEPYRPKVLRAERPSDNRHLIRYDPRDLRNLWFRDPESGCFHERPWTSSRPDHGSQATPPFGSSFAEPNKKRPAPRHYGCAW